MSRFRFLVALIVLTASLNISAVSQIGSGAVRGQVTDPSGAAVTKATVVVKGAGGESRTVRSNQEGAYEFTGLAPGKYTLKASAKGFADFETEYVDIVSGRVQRLDIPLSIKVETEKVTVETQTGQLDVNPALNASSIVLTGKDLDALSDDPDELQSDLEALAGPSAGPDGGQLYIDGFTAGQLPPKASIREIRINQNPFSSEYDKLGYGRIEVFTKPGSDQYHGQVFVLGNSSAFNSHNPYAGSEEGYDSTQYSGNISGPLSKQASFFFSAERRNINDLAAINAEVLGPDLNPMTILDSVPNPRHRTNIGPRFDYAISKNNTLTARYQFFRDSQDNDGIGQFNLPSQGYNEVTDEHTVQIGDTQVYGAKVVNETRFQYLRENDTQNALSTDPTINVRGAFGGGGNSQGTIIDHQDHFEVQNYTSVIHGNHTIKFGARVRALSDASYSTSSFNGTFTFSSMAQYQAVECSFESAPPPGCPVATIPAPTPEQLSITTGSPHFN